MSIVQLKDKEVENINGGTLAAAWELESKGNTLTVEAGLKTTAAFTTANGNIPDGNIPGVDITFQGVVVR